MSSNEIPFDNTAELNIYKKWENSGSFAAKPASGKDPFTIMIPPPNVTGSLHIGHALTMTLQDTLVRWNRMRNRDALWQPGTDHAGIATQMVVERQLIEKGKTRQELGRDNFIEQIWKWKEESGGKITGQLRRLGASLDWERERFTMDDGLSKAVREAFVSLHKEGLIYRDRRLVNWDPKFQSAISDLEVENKEVKGNLWYINYPVADEAGKFITIATTRPETLLADVAIAVNPNDERYTNLVGKFAIIPLVGRRIPIIADDYSDLEKGTGAVKITPAHDFNDFAVGQRHKLTTPSILTATAQITIEEIQEFIVETETVSRPDFLRSLVDQDRFVARKSIIAELESMGLLEKTEPHTSQIPHAERGGTVIEPRLTTQWFCNAAVLAKPAVEAVEKGDVKFVPKQWENTFYAWMNDIQPWCISRQLWWGHRIPAWYGPDGKVFVNYTEAEALKEAEVHYGQATELKQDDDVLDTWFSSSLWPFSTLGWPDKTADLSRYYPGDVLVTGFDIIFFWVARMMMMGLHFMKDVPFKTVYMHGLVRDEHGQKMSKTKGNVIDPLELIDKYGADALRWAVCALSGPGRDMKLGVARVELGRSFITKLRNAAAFCNMNGIVPQENFDPANVQSSLCRWLIATMNDTITEATKALEAFRFDEYADSLYRLVWNNFCDWFIELAKIELNGPNAAEVRATGAYVLGNILRLLHPAVPFVTEYLWENFGYNTESSLIEAQWPKAIQIAEADSAKDDVNWIIQFISAMRNVRAEKNLPYSKIIPLALHGASVKAAERTRTWSSTLQNLLKTEEIVFLEGTIPQDAIQIVIDEAIIVLQLADVIDPVAEQKRLTKEITKIQENIEKISRQLNDPNFTSRAPAVIIEKNKKILEAANEDIIRLEKALNNLGL